jgi:hypothetical protein
MFTSMALSLGVPADTGSVGVAGFGTKEGQTIGIGNGATSAVLWPNAKGQQQVQVIQFGQEAFMRKFRTHVQSIQQWASDSGYEYKPIDLSGSSFKSTDKGCAYTAKVRVIEEELHALPYDGDWLLFFDVDIQYTGCTRMAFTNVMPLASPGESALIAEISPDPVANCYL